MIECREIVDSVKADISSTSPDLNMVSSEKMTDAKIVLDKDGNICRECTDLQVRHRQLTKKRIVNITKFSVFRPSLPRIPGVCLPSGPG